MAVNHTVISNLKKVGSIFLNLGEQSPSQKSGGFFVGRTTSTYSEKRKFIIRMSRVKLHNKQELLSAISTNREVIKAYGVNRLGIFGSFSKGTSTASSDVDLLVDFIPEKKTFDNFMDLSFFLEELFGRKVELVTPQSLSKFIGPYILKEVENVGL